VLKALELPEENELISYIRGSLKNKQKLASVRAVLENSGRKERHFDAKASIPQMNDRKFQWSHGGSFLVEEQIGREKSRTGFRQIISKELQVNPRAIVSGDKVAFCVTDKYGVIQSCSEKFLQMTGYSLYEVCGVNCNFLQRDAKGVNRTDPLAIQALREAIEKGEEHHTVLYNHTKWGAPFWNLLHLYPLKTAGVVDRYIGVQEKIDDKEAQELGGKIAWNFEVPPRIAA